MNKDKFLVKDGNRAEWGVPEGYPWKESFTGEFTILEEETVTVYKSTGYAGALSVTPNIEIGKEYIIRFNGNEYKTTAFEIQSNGNYALTDTGNTELFNFAIIVSNNSAFLMTHSEGSYTISISIFDTIETIQPIAIEFLPEGYPYVSEPANTIIVPETMLSFPGEGVIENPFIFDPVIGETYSITYDEVVYECIAAEQSENSMTAVYVGNLAMIGGKDTGEPFIIMNSNNQFGIIGSPNEIHTISIEGIVREVHPISSKFLPTETWTFTLDDGSTVTKKVAIGE